LRIVPIHPHPIIRNPDEASASFFYFNGDERAACVQTVVDKFFNNRSRTLDDLTSSNSTRYIIWKDLNFSSQEGRHGIGSERNGWYGRTTGG
jgi:hypothetical protein